MRPILAILALFLSGCSSFSRNQPPSTWGRIRHGQNVLDPGPKL